MRTLSGKGCVNPMYKIAVLGDKDSILGFKALGLETFPVESVEEGKKTLHDLARGNMLWFISRSSWAFIWKLKLPATRTRLPPLSF